MKEIMRARFVPTNYLRTVYDKLTQLKQGSLTVDAYYMEMEMLLQRARVRESAEMTMQRFLHGLKYNIKGIVRHHQYNTMNELLHHAREAESQLAEEAQIKARYATAGRFSNRTQPPLTCRLTALPAAPLLLQQNQPPLFHNQRNLLLAQVPTCPQPVTEICYVIHVEARDASRESAQTEK